MHECRLECEKSPESANQQLRHQLLPTKCETSLKQQWTRVALLLVQGLTSITAESVAEMPQRGRCLHALQFLPAQSCLYLIA